jgi:hypothetical protein
MLRPLRALDFDTLRYSIGVPSAPSHGTKVLPWVIEHLAKPDVPLKAEIGGGDEQREARTLASLRFFDNTSDL